MDVSLAERQTYRTAVGDPHFWQPISIRIRQRIRYLLWAFQWDERYER